MGNPNWTRDEVLLALDLYVELGSLSGGSLPPETHDDVVALSALLNALPVHPLDEREANFRNPDGVALKLGNLRNAEYRVREELGHDVSSLPRGMDAGAAMDRSVMAEFYGRWDALKAEAASLRRGAGAGAPPALPPPAKGGTVVVSSAPIDGGGIEEYESTSSGGGSRTRVEAALVKRYADAMTAAGHTMEGRHYRVPGQARVLRADLFIVNQGVLIEAKGTISRDAIRLALGQVLDYARFHSPRPKLVILLPQKPERDMLDLLAEFDVACVWEKAGGGFMATAGAKALRP